LDPVLLETAMNTISTISGTEIDFSQQDRAERSSHLLRENVPHKVSLRIVLFFEIIDIQDDQCQRNLMPYRQIPLKSPQHRLLKRLIKQISNFPFFLGSLGGDISILSKLLSCCDSNWPHEPSFA